MARKTYRKKSKTRKTIKRGGVGSDKRRKLAQTNESIQKVDDIVKQIRHIENPNAKNIASTLERIMHTLKKNQADLASSLVKKTKSTVSYDMGADRGATYDMGADTGPAYDMGADAGPAYDMGADSGSPDYMEVMADSGSPPVAEKAPIEEKASEVLSIRPGSWGFCALQILSSDPKNENELIELMRSRFPERITGKTPDNTLNRTLQELVKEGYAERVEYKKGSRKTYKYFISTKKSPKTEQINPSQEEFENIMKNILDKKEYNRKDLVKLTPENAKQYIGYNILFKTRKQYIVKKIVGVSKTGKSISIEHPDLNNSLEITSRQVYVIVNSGRTES